MRKGREKIRAQETVGRKRGKKEKKERKAGGERRNRKQ